MGLRGRPLLTPQQFEQRLTKRYGSTFVEEIKLLEKYPYMTLESIAKKYNITRQYVSCVVKKMNQKPKRTIRKENREEVRNMCSCDPRATINFQEPTSPSQVSRYVKDIVLNKCEQNGYEINKIQLTGIMTINNKRVAIRGATKSQLVGLYQYFRFTIPQEAFDIFICHVVPNKQTFIFKREDVGNKQLHLSDTNSNNPIFCQKRPKKHLEKWSLLQNEA